MVFSERIFAMATKQSPIDPHTQIYFLAYAETTRLWRRVIVAVTFDDPAMRDMALTGSWLTRLYGYNYNILSNSLGCLLMRLLPTLPLFSSISRLSLSLSSAEDRSLVQRSSKLTVAEDTVEKDLISDRNFLRDLSHLGCAILIESEVLMESRFSVADCISVVGSDRYIEYKAPFASTDLDGPRSLKSYMIRLKRSIALRDCPGVANFKGVVLDDTRSYLKSYLCELPTVHSLSRMVAQANMEHATVPWADREMWAYQIVNAVSHIHRRGQVVGLLELMRFGARSNGSAMLLQPWQSQIQMEDWAGIMPPELRTDCGNSRTSQSQPMTYATDMFQLGMLLWLLAEHRRTTNGRFCVSAACTSFPRFKCAAHCNPVELPPCRGEVPLYFADMIRRCRLHDPQARPSAHELIKLFPTHSHELSDKKLFNSLADRIGFSYVICNECGDACGTFHYHCSKCLSDDWDLCPSCFQQGVGCYDSDHQLTKTVLRNGTLVVEG